ncbi:ABC transporter ATP-binding protein [Desulfogranum japonicum]|uniref:ABC transporter ATP-binding protein n=1 Tax=Desulfogranum japonicum TaxID=231447 RepID=UPI000418A2F9|nr:ABC transporter ATP-binding protein [Desulfogranum japonicum]
MGKVSLENVTKWYGKHIVCDNVSLEIKEGQFFTLLGPSGCGKTTLLRLIAGFIRPDNGAIFLHGVDITNFAPEKRNVGMVFQNYALFPFMTVGENIEYGLKIQKRSRSEIRQKVEQYLSLVGLERFEKRNIADLSGGEQQRVALARSLAIEPGVLLLDEPLSNLDARLRDSMRTELKRLQRNLGITTIFVTHDQVEALTMSDQLAVFKKGVCVQKGTPEEIYDFPANSFVATFVGETNLFPVNFQNGCCMLPNGHILTHITQRSVCFVSIRPQDLRLSLQLPANSDYGIWGTIRDKHFHGYTTEWAIQADGLLFKAVQLNSGQAASSLGVGSQVCVCFSPADLHLLNC